MAIARPDMIQRLSTDRLIRVYVGTEDCEPFLVQQTLLETVSEYFVNALKPDRFKEGQEGCLFFPEDDILAWDVLMDWLFNGRVLDEDEGVEQLLAVKCWVLGDKYGISRFQDDVMFDLLNDIAISSAFPDVIREAFVSAPPGSATRMLMAEEAFGWWDADELEVVFEEFGATKFIGDLIAAKVQYEDGDEKRDRFLPFWRGVQRKAQEPLWTSYMVGDGAERLKARVKKD